MSPKLIRIIVLLLVGGGLIVLAILYEPGDAGSAGGARSQDPGIEEANAVLDSAFMKLSGDLQYAQNHETLGGEKIKIEFDPEQNSYCLLKVSRSGRETVLTHPGKHQPYREYFALIAGLEKVRLESADFAGQPVLYFEIGGFPSSGGTISLSCEGISRTFQLDATTGKLAQPE